MRQVTDAGRSGWAASASVAAAGALLLLSGCMHLPERALEASALTAAEALIGAKCASDERFRRNVRALDAVSEAWAAGEPSSGGERASQLRKLLEKLCGPAAKPTASAPPN